MCEFHCCNKYPIFLITMFSRRSEAEGEVDHGVAERFLDLADLPRERRSRAGAHRHILAEGWNAVGGKQ